MPVYVVRKSRNGRLKTVQIDRAALRPRNAEIGRMVSVNARVNPHQVKAANKMMASAGVNAKFDPRTGNMVVEGGRREYLKALKVRGIVNLDEVRGGRSR